MNKHQMSAEVFVVGFFLKEDSLGWPVLFSKRNNNKNIR